ncbi:hypothetical protein HK413_12065 [Mucilaginibacter sp. S1162]|uniref:Uncharacterized protein n=1 Tax=Mucilaginibacter humi TaxID=2732510 RepID=A0ABX1W5P1_9SPHI|nr:hypothetical protein [Mucilaginibacter humi]NNU34624.1 hypothetical protein [Mucilaginibacter humi]
MSADTLSYRPITLLMVTHCNLALSYKTLKLPISAYQPQMFVTLEATNTQLEEVRITSGKLKTLTLSKFSGATCMSALR